ncbi:MAG: aldolase/citrate lyase family protein [Thermoguttaceae bacterium]|nr:aldolase/citrate lyase family protein [Thermoguttaceae bacterium]MDW8077586.1 aldolase/citrate lyase family protein [Thermoguttaceae bacterium]
MMKNPVKERLRQGEVSFGTWITLGSLHATRLLARSGFEWLTLDLEHAPIDWSHAASLIGAIADAGCVPLVRVPEGSVPFIKRALDAGAFGIVVPMVNNAAQGQLAIAAAKYPPIGVRSAGGGMHALNFRTTVEEYYQHANDEILVVLQIESPQGVENAEAIASLPGCDAIFIGPVDLRFTMRRTDGTFPSPEEHEAAVQSVLRACRRCGTPVGIHCMDAESAVARARQGMQFLAVGSDLRMLASELGRWVETLWPGRKPREIGGY